MNLVNLLLVICLVIGVVIGTEEGSGFDDEIHYIEPETGGRLTLQSKGKLSAIIDLDQTPAVKRVLCKGNKILVALKKDEPDVTSWKPGQLVIGSGNWSCAHNVLKPESKTIYAKVAEIKRPKDHVVELHTTDAGPLDMFERADIRVHYEQGRLVPSRHRRYLSNPLRTVLNRVDWNTSFTENIPFNLNHDNTTEEEINLYKKTGKYEPSVDTVENTTYDGNDFLFRCFSCHGYSQISYFFELKVYKVDNKAVVKKYTMEMDLNTHVQQNYSLYTEEEISLTKTGTFQQSQRSTIFQTEIAKFKTLPPIVLTVDYTSQSNIEFKASTKKATIYNGDFRMNGRTVITQKFEEGKPSQNDVAVYDWTVTSSEQNVNTNGTMNATFAVFQNMTVFPALSWPMKDVNMNLGPPIHVSTRPSVNVFSSTDTVARCDNSSIAIDSNVTVAETDFSVEAFGIPIWNVKLMNSLKRKLDILQQPLMYRCHADCHGPLDRKADDTMETACLEPSGPIVRGDDRFQRLHQLCGDYILFTSEESSSTWCGQRGNQCVNCTGHVVGNDDNSKCADRMMNHDLATSVTRLAKFVKAEWPERKLIVKEAWDEPTSDHPHGSHGNVSVFYEGRAAEVAISKPNAQISKGIPTIETDESILQRLGELAVCSNFAYVKNEQSSVTMCVEKKIHSSVRKRSLLSRTRRSGHVEHSMVKEMLENLGGAVQASLGDLGTGPTISVGNSYPPGKTMEQACGAFTGSVSQDDSQRFRRLIEYPLNDVDFEAEGPGGSWCGVETRQCTDCNSASDDLEDHWSWCGTRTMHMRLATRLQRLVVIAKGHVKVEKALSMNNTDGSSKLFMEGRAARLSLSPGSTLTMADFASKAVLAGFDYVSFASPRYLDVCVKVQDGIQTHLVQFPKANLVGVPLPLGEEDEYNYPQSLRNESRKPLLFDVSTSSNNVANHFRLSNFVSPGKRFIRLDAVLVNLLDLGFEAFDGGFYVISGSGYRPRSVNLDNIATRHEKEMLRYEMGQAVEIKPNRPANDGSLFDLAIALIKVAKTVRMQRIGIGIGSKPDRLYFEIRPMAEEDSKAIEVWDSGNTNLYKKLEEIQTLVYKGGTVVSAREDSVICSKPVLGENYFYFNFDLDESGHCWSDNGSDFCPETHEHRYNISLVLQRRLTSAAGTGKLPRKDILPEIENCVVDTCGGCPSAGDIWKQKVIKCTEMILRYLERASTPFQPLMDKVAVFNTENHESSVHSQACHDGSICVENTQIYSLLMPVITATYKHENTEELLFGGADNPSPLLEIVEQELAWRAEGKVKVYIENAKDINALRNDLMILMMYNKKVSDVTFHLDPDADEDDVIITLQRKVEQWSGSVCPTWSRLVSTPYTFETIPHERKKRSLERSRDRNQMKLEMKNWELDWMLKS